MSIISAKSLITEVKNGTQSVNHARKLVRCGDVDGYDPAFTFIKKMKDEWNRDYLDSIFMRAMSVPAISKEYVEHYLDVFEVVKKSERTKVKPLDIAAGLLLPIGAVAILRKVMK